MPRIHLHAPLFRLPASFRSRQAATFLFLAIILFSVAALAQSTSVTQGEKKRLTLTLAPDHDSMEVQAPNPKGADPKPANAEIALLDAFDKYEVVGIGAAHGNKDLDDFILHLVRNPAFPNKVNVIAVECGNSLYQSTLDRYIAGADVPLSEVRQVWRNTTQPMCGVSAFYEQLFPLVRRINQTLPPGKKLRMLAADPPIDWNKVKTAQDFARGKFLDRDPGIASVMKEEVLSRHLKALMLFGTAHLFHGGATAVGIYEKDYPGVTLVIADHTGFGNGTPFEKYNDQLEARMASWPIPSLVQDLKGTWLADLLDMTFSTGNITFGPPDAGNLPSGSPKPKRTLSELPPPEAKSKFSKLADAYLYLGPRDLLLNEPTPSEVVSDREYMAELQRREAIVGEGPIADQTNPKNIGDRDSNPFFYDPGARRKLMQPLGPSVPLPTGPGK
jgi:hypothetical protein